MLLTLCHILDSKDHLLKKLKCSAVNGRRIQLDMS